MIDHQPPVKKRKTEVTSGEDVINGKTANGDDSEKKDANGDAAEAKDEVPVKEAVKATDAPEAEPEAVTAGGDE
jgi:hypothetical protein